PSAPFLSCQRAPATGHRLALSRPSARLEHVLRSHAAAALTGSFLVPRHPGLDASTVSAGGRRHFLSRCPSAGMVRPVPGVGIPCLAEKLTLDGGSCPHPSFKTLAQGL